ncbi:MAG: dTDP-4-dehydrorhamnose 3,5-epimerase [Minisyncoccota bacterium]
MQVLATDIAGVFIIEPDFFTDTRGVFWESYHAERYAEQGITELFVQDNVSVSHYGVLRGLHYQTPPFAQGKLVQVLAGKVLDVAVDIRFGSPTFGKYVSIELSGDNRRQLWIPVGFAHGFVTLSDETIFSYKCTNVYSKEHDRGVRFNDPVIGIAWGIADPVVSEKDASQPLLADIPKEYVFTAND